MAHRGTIMYNQSISVAECSLPWTVCDRLACGKTMAVAVIFKCLTVETETIQLRLSQVHQKRQEILLCGIFVVIYPKQFIFNATLHAQNIISVGALACNTTNMVRAVTWVLVANLARLVLL